MRAVRAAPRATLAPGGAPQPQPRRAAPSPAAAPHAPAAPSPSPHAPAAPLPRRAALAALAAPLLALALRPGSARAASLFGPRAVDASAPLSPPAPGSVAAKEVSSTDALAALLDGREALADAAAIRGAEGGKRLRLRHAHTHAGKRETNNIRTPRAHALTPHAPPPRTRTRARTRRGRLPALSATVQTMSAFLPAAVAAATASSPDAVTPLASEAQLDAVGRVLVGASTVVQMERIGREREFEDAEIPQARAKKRGDRFSHTPAHAPFNSGLRPKGASADLAAWSPMVSRVHTCARVSCGRLC
jgi:hypothetical protein